MKKAFTLLFVLFVCLFAGAQSAADAAVRLTATAQLSPPQITLSWPTTAASTQYQIYRKLKSAAAWGPIISIQTGSATQYVDNTVTAGVSYEYRVSRSASGYTGHGYINAGIEVPEIAHRGKILLIVDSTFLAPLAVELQRLAEDMEGDGWTVITQAVDRNGSVPHVKSIIVSAYNADPLDTKAVFLFGHVPVPYSGFLNPDGHTDHVGAWPADVFYGDVNGSWTDLSGPGSSTASPPRTENYPADGKYDQSIIAGEVELQVGRVDLSAMPGFTATGNEEQLLRNYLDKDHAYRKKLFAPERRAVIDDNFGYFSGEAFAASGYKNFAPLVGTTSVTAADYITSLNAGSYLWSYGCGGGSYTSAGGIGNSAAIAGATLQGVFTMLFGSYFGDWDVPNSFLRAPLAKGTVLTNVWSGRPHYQFHHMGLGENIGYSMRLTQNHAGGLYFGNPFGITGKWIHNALMGDPTLRNDVVAPVSNVEATKSGFDCIVYWSASTETAIVGYNIYMKNDTNTSYVKINASPVSGTTYTDQCLQYKGIYKYMVRALKLEDTPSGSYYNMSEGIADTALNTSDITVHAAFSAAVSGSVVTIVNTSTNALSYSWDFGNSATSNATNPSTSYTANGMYTISLVSSGSCDSDTAFHTVNICNWLATASFSAYLHGDTLLTQNTSLNASGYYWNFGNGFTSNAFSPATTYAADGTYTVMLVVINSCSSDTAYSIVYYSTSGLSDLVVDHGVRVFPNPITETLNVEADMVTELRILNNLGQIIYQIRQFSGSIQIDSRNFERGTYFVELISESALHHRKVIKH